MRAERLANAEELRLAAAEAHDALSGDGDEPDAGALLAEARRALERGHDPPWTISPGRSPTSATGPPTWRLSAGYLADLDETGPHELAAVEERRAELDGARPRARLARRGDRLLESGSARLVELDDDGDRIERLTSERDAAASALDDAAAALTAARAAAAHASAPR